MTYTISLAAWFLVATSHAHSTGTDGAGQKAMRRCHQSRVLWVLMVLGKRQCSITGAQSIRAASW